MAHINDKDGLEDCISCALAKLEGNQLVCSKTNQQVNDNDWCEEFKE